MVERATAVEDLEAARKSAEVGQASSLLHSPLRKRFGGQGIPNSSDYHRDPGTAVGVNRDPLGLAREAEVHVFPRKVARLKH